MEEWQSVVAGVLHSLSTTTVRTVWPKDMLLSYLQMMNQAPALDEPLLRKLAAETGGRYFRATDAEALEGIFQIIDRLEASELEGRTFTRYRELSAPLIALALGLLLLDLLLGMTLLEVLP